mgnify:CR=1 FL=1
MIRVARAQRLTSIADFMASRYGKSPALAGLVTLVTMVGIVPYIALQLKAIAFGYAVLTQPAGAGGAAGGPWWTDGTLYAALALAGFTMIFGTRQLDGTERHEGMVAAIAFESVVKLVAFVAVGLYVTWGLFGGPAELFAQALARPELAALLRLAPEGGRFAYEQWFALTLLSMLSVLFLPRQFQVMVVACCTSDAAPPMPTPSCSACRWPPVRTAWPWWPSSAGCRPLPAWSSSRPSPSRPWSATTW